MRLLFATVTLLILTTAEVHAARTLEGSFVPSTMAIRSCW